MPQKNEQRVLVFVPALVAVLKAAEDAKKSPLDEDEVLSIRDKAVCMVVSIPMALEMEKRRGYRDIVPEIVWEEWVELRTQL